LSMLCSTLSGSRSTRHVPLSSSSRNATSAPQALEICRCPDRSHHPVSSPLVNTDVRHGKIDVARPLIVIGCMVKRGGEPGCAQEEPVGKTGESEGLPRVSRILSDNGRVRSSRQSPAPAKVFMG
jgi:hypothetical protein